MNDRGLQLERAKLLREVLFKSVSLYGSETVAWREKETSTIRVVQMDNLRCLLGVRRINKMQNIRIKEVCGVTKEMNERIEESDFRWFGHTERMKNNGITK